MFRFLSKLSSVLDNIHPVNGKFHIARIYSLKNCYGGSFIESKFQNFLRLSTMVGEECYSLKLWKVGSTASSVNQICWFNFSKYPLFQCRIVKYFSYYFKTFVFCTTSNGTYECTVEEVPILYNTKVRGVFNTLPNIYDIFNI